MDDARPRVWPLLAAFLLIAVFGSDSALIFPAIDPPVREPAWSKALPAMGEDNLGSIRAQVLRDEVIVHGVDQVAAPDRRSGKVRWTLGTEMGDAVWVADDAVVVLRMSLGYFYESDAAVGVAAGAVVLDARTGKQRYAVEAGKGTIRTATVTSDSLVVHRCAGDPDERCKVDVVDLGTGRQRWTRPVKRHYEVVPPGLGGAEPELRLRQRAMTNDGRNGPMADAMRTRPARNLVIEAGPDLASRDDRDQVTNSVVDLHTGTEVMRWRGPASEPGHASVIGGSYVQWSGCPGEVSVRDVRTGRQRWSDDLGDRSLINDSPWAPAPELEPGTCPGSPLLLSGKRLVHYRDGGPPRLTDLSTGTDVWRGSFMSPVVAVDDDTAVLLQDVGTKDPPRMWWWPQLPRSALRGGPGGG